MKKMIFIGIFILAGASIIMITNLDNVEVQKVETTQQTVPANVKPQSHPQNEEKKKSQYVLEKLTITNFADFSATPPAQVQLKVHEDGKKIGDAQAIVHVFEFLDFQCPVCGRAFREMKPVMEAFPTKVLFHFANYPLKIHPKAMDAAMAAESAKLQGKFLQYAEKLFLNQNALSESDLVRYASEIGLDVEKFKKDFKNPELKKIIEKDSKIAEDFGIKGTPGFLVNGTKIVGWASTESMKSMINQEIKSVEEGLKKGGSLKDILKTRKDGEKFVKLLH